MADLVLTSRRDEVLTISLNRQEKRNALSFELIEALADAVEAASSDTRARVIVFTGEGKCFSAGMDLKGVIEDPEKMGRMLHRLSETMGAIRALPMPTIALVRGAAIGGGCGLMVVTDFAISHPKAKLGYPEVDLGVCPAVVAPWLMKKIGPGPARAMLLTGGTITGDEAHRLGLVDRLVEVHELDQAVGTLAASLSAGGETALRVTKQWLGELDGSDNASIAQRAADLSAEVIQGEEAQERLRAKFAD